jgi:hypothetical protein
VVGEEIVVQQRLEAVLEKEGQPGEPRVNGLKCEPPDLQSLRRQFEGEILLVRGQGKVARFTDNSGQ